MARLFSHNRNGFTLAELLIVISILGILAAALLAILDPLTQLKKARDARRKTDLTKMKKVLEDYYNDNNKYPASVAFCEEGAGGISTTVCDPVNSGSHIYTYVTTGDATIPDRQWYRIYTDFENDNDQAAVNVGCNCNSCCKFSLRAQDPFTSYNWCVSSSNVSICSGTFASAVDCGVSLPWICLRDGCNQGDVPGCRPVYCGDSTCGGECNYEKRCDK